MTTGGLLRNGTQAAAFWNGLVPDSPEPHTGSSLEAQRQPGHDGPKE